ncbi:MAG TPA: hypothetical protein VG096_06050 [Bryobacteraceae bacterium]|jgi:hypothetical protein|nr:hypothetical protein [Bryobacteraceae bacterium]
MALKLKQPGPNIIGAFSQGLTESPDLGESFVPNSAYHLPSYTLSLKDLNNLPNSQGIDSIARLVAWQCVAISEDQQHLAVGEVTTLHKAPRPSDHVFDGPVRMTCLSHGEILNNAYTKAKDLHDRQPQLTEQYKCDGDFEPRVLRIPGLLITAFWLKSDAQGKQDWVVPLHTKIDDLTAKEVYGMDEFVTIIKRAAADCLASPIFD